MFVHVTWPQLVKTVNVGLGPYFDNQMLLLTNVKHIDLLSDNNMQAIESFVETNSRVLKFVSIGVFGLSYYLIKTYKLEKDVLFRQLEQEKVKNRQLEQQIAALAQDYDTDIILWGQVMDQKMKLEHERVNLVKEKTHSLDKLKIFLNSWKKKR